MKKISKVESIGIYKHPNDVYLRELFLCLDRKTKEEMVFWLTSENKPYYISVDEFINEWTPQN